MILQRLYELAERENLLDDPSLARQPVPFVVQVGPGGKYLGIQERRSPIVTPSRKKDAPPKTRPGRGDDLLVPKPHGNTANKGFACFFADTLARVMPLDDDAKSARSRETFWKQLEQAAKDTGDAALVAVSDFGRALASDPALVDRVRADLSEKNAKPSERCTFAFDPDDGTTIVERPAVRSWYRSFYDAVMGARAASSVQGLCQITGERTALPRSHATKIAGVPNGISSGVSVVSYDKAAFESYGLDGAVNSGIGARAADGYTRALNDLIANKLPGGRRTRRVIGDVLFVYWTRRRVDDDALVLLDEPTPEQVERLLTSAADGRQSATTEPNDFYCLGLTGNGARAMVREYLEVPLSRVRENLARWFADLRIVDERRLEARCDFPLWMLANATVRESKDLPPDIATALHSAALKGAAVPDHVLAACLRRIRVEGATAAFLPQRMGMIKLILNRKPSKGVTMLTEALNPEAERTSPGYACGRLMACLARCQHPKSFGAEAQILERYFASASTTPRFVFPVLLRLNRHHVRKARDESPGLAANLERELEDRIAPFLPGPGGDPDFPAVLSLHEQGRFALGYYQQRAAYRAASAQRKAAQAAAAETSNESL